MKVDIAIITIREDEFTAVRERFQTQRLRTPSGREWLIGEVTAHNQNRYSIAITRSIAQGNDSSQRLAHDIIQDLDPQLLLLVGIAGGIPHNEFTLGDVIISTNLVTLSLDAMNPNGTTNFMTVGSPSHPLVEQIVSHLQGDPQLDNWNVSSLFQIERPKVDLQNAIIHGSEEWRQRVQDSLARHFGQEANQSRLPLFKAGPIISSNHLIKDPFVLMDLLKTLRDILAVEMEAAGIYEAARRQDRNYPVMVIRGISDIIGLQRDEKWTAYACQSAAAFTSALINAAPIDPRTSPSIEPDKPADTFDSRTAQGTSNYALSEESIRKFLTQEKVLGLQDTDPRDLYGNPRQLAFLRQETPTYAVLLCFGKDPTHEVKGAYTRCIRWQGTTRVRGWSEEKTYQKGLLEQYTDACNFLRHNLRLARHIGNNGSQEQWEIPLRVLQEALANALIHRDYERDNNPVYVEIYDDRVEISSPGKPLLPIEQLGRTYVSRPRNPLIMKIFYLNGDVEKMGSGIERMKALLQEAKLPDPEFQLDEENMFKVTIHRPPDSQELKLKETQAELKETQAELKETQVQASDLRQKQKKSTVLLRVMALFVTLIIIGSGSWGYYAYSHPDPTRVTTLKDSGQGSLRQAIQAGNIITFDPDLQGTIYLTSSDLDLNKNITVHAPKQGNISITSKYGFTISIEPAATVTFENLTFTHSTTTNDAFIQNQGHLTFNNCIISHNISYKNGGGLANMGGSVTLNDTTVSDNTTGDKGGGIYNWNGPLTLNHSTVSNNSSFYYGGGIFSLLGSVTIINTNTITNNKTTSPKSVDSVGGGIALLNSLLTLSSTGIGSTRNIIQHNSTQGNGGGIALLGSQAIITNTIITDNSAGQSGGGIAVGKDTEDDKVGFATITDREIADTSQTASFIGKNKAPQNSDILGTLRTDGSRPLIISVSSGITGSPAPFPFPPEQSPQYRGVVDLDIFCQSMGYQEFRFHAPYDPYTLKCIAPSKTDRPFTPAQACQWKTGTTDVMTRLSDYYDPSSWQCYVHEKKLGNIATSENMNNFCQFLGNIGVVQIGITAYDWQCAPASGIPIGLSMTNACQWLYGQKDAFDSLVDFNKPSGWECWAPR